MKKSNLFLRPIVMVTLTLLLTKWAAGATFIVTTADDEVDSANSTLSLREAIGESVVGDTITFDPNVFSGGINNVITLTQGQLLITETFTIDASRPLGERDD